MARTPTSVSSSLSFLQSVREILSRLGDDTSEEAAKIRSEAERLQAEIEAWNDNPPTSSVRTEGIGKVLTLYRQTCDYQARRHLEAPKTEKK